MTFLTDLLLGDGSLKPALRASLEDEGLVFVEEGLPGSLHYKRFKAPGRRHDGKVTPQRFAVGMSEKRFVVYCRSGRTKLVNTPFSDERLGAVVDVSPRGSDSVSIRIDFDRADVPKVSGEIEIRMETRNAPGITEQFNSRVGR